MKSALYPPSTPRSSFVSPLLSSSPFNLGLVALVLLCGFSNAIAVDQSASNTFLLPRQSNLTTPNASTNQTQNLVEIRESVHCYALPYGGLGFASHILTYYCIVVNAYGRCPYWPWKRQEYQGLDIMIGLLQLIGTTISGTLTIARCREDTQLEMLGIWMVLTSVASSIAAMLGHGRWMCAGSRRTECVALMTPATVACDPVAYQLQPYHSDPAAENSALSWQSQPYHDPSKACATSTSYPVPPAEPVLQRTQSALHRFFANDQTDYKLNGNRYGQWVSWGLIISIWLVGCFIGFIGSVSIAAKVWHAVKQVREITIWFFLPPAIMIGFTILYCWATGRDKDGRSRAMTEEEARTLWVLMKSSFKTCLFFLVFMLVYMDWLLAAVTGNWSGVPSQLDKGGQILYWVYFACKRLALFMS